MKNIPNFRKTSEAAANMVGVEVFFYENEEYQEPFEDDGVLHIVNSDGVRASFCIGQDVSKTDYNRTAKIVMRQLGLVPNQRALR